MEKITKVIGMCDSQTRDHQNRVSTLAVWIGQRMSLPSSQIERIRITGMIHDIGKVAMPAEFMVKTSNLSASERLIVMEHPQVGFDLLKGCGLSAAIKQSVLQHHEHIEGSGYPQHLKGDQILTEAKVVSVADVVDAMTSQRLYNTVLELDDALCEIAKHKGTYYDPSAVNACLRLFSKPQQHRNVVTAIGSLNHQPMCC